MRVVTQADDPSNADYVENTLVAESRVVFAMLNITAAKRPRCVGTGSSRRRQISITER